MSVIVPENIKDDKAKSPSITKVLNRPTKNKDNKHKKGEIICHSIQIEASYAIIYYVLYFMYWTNKRCAYKMN